MEGLGEVQKFRQSRTASKGGCWNSNQICLVWLYTNHSLSESLKKGENSSLRRKLIWWNQKKILKSLFQDMLVACLFIFVQHIQNSSPASPTTGQGGVLGLVLLSLKMRCHSCLWFFTSLLWLTGCASLISDREVCCRPFQSHNVSRHQTWRLLQWSVGDCDSFWVLLPGALDVTF